MAVSTVIHPLLLRITSIERIKWLQQWIFGIQHLMILTDQQLDICPNLQQKHCIGKQIFLVGMELLNNAHHIREMDFGDLPQIWEKTPMFHWGWLAIHW